MRRAVLLFVMSVMIQSMSAQVYPVIRKKALWFDGKGEVHVTGDAIEFRASKEKASRRWLYQDIQYFDRISEKEFVILSYEDQKWKLGRDRAYHFMVTDGELTDAVFDEISRRLGGRPVTNRVVQELPGTGHEIPVKHLHTFGGCEGTLVFEDKNIYYRTDHQNDAREWRLDRDVQSVWSRNPYQLEVHVFDNNRREFSRTRIFNFALKRPLDAEFYRDLKLRTYQLEVNNRVIP